MVKWNDGRAKSVKMINYFDIWLRACLDKDEVATFLNTPWLSWGQQTQHKPLKSPQVISSN